MDSSAKGYSVRLSEISRISLSDSASDSDDDEDKSYEDDVDEADEALPLFFFFFFFSRVFALFTITFGDFSVLDSGHLVKVDHSRFGSGFFSLVAGCDLGSGSGSGDCSGFMSGSGILVSVSISSTLEVVFLRDTSGDGVGGAV